MVSAKVLIMLTIIVYLGGMVGIGVYCSKKNENVGDFYLGGRKLGPFVTAMSAEASDMSGWLLMGLPGLAYIAGIAEPVWTAIGLGIGTYINWLMVAKRIRTYTHEVNAITLPDFFSLRYRDDKNILMGIAALFIIVFFIPYTASGFAACGKLFSSIFAIDYLPAMIISAIVIVAYTATGGFLAASTTDLIQSIVMSIALVVVVFFGIHVAGGIDAVAANANSMVDYLSLTASHAVGEGTTTPYGFLTIVSTLAWGLGYFGMPHILLRFMAIEDKEKLKLSRRIATIWVFIAMGVAIFIGVVGNAMTAAGVLPFLEGSSSETIIVVISDFLSRYGALAAILGGVILAGILASTMSTADSQLLAASSSFSQNLVRGFFRVNISEKTAMVLARASVLGIAVIGAFIARDPNSSVFRIVSFAWAGFGATFGPVVLTSLFWKRSNKQGALAGMIVGGVMVFVWKYLVRPMGGIWDIYELLPAFLLALAAIVIVSLATAEPSKEIQDEFDRVKASL
ncbi:MAG: sodium/proline symporter [Bacteroidales bacterium]|nr:sodium/solute symporter [Anaerotignum sp.]MCI5679813.1 sodium/proline symporter [Bacteroidales bacterium]MDY3925829.1 sodium/proline symporter [Anaerotignum sp.]